MNKKAQLGLGGIMMMFIAVIFGIVLITYPKFSNRQISSNR